MISSQLGEWFAVGALFGAVYCFGGLHGLWLAWSQPARMSHWAGRVHRAQLRLNALEERSER